MKLCTFITTCDWNNRLIDWLYQQNRVLLFQKQLTVSQKKVQQREKERKKELNKLIQALKEYKVWMLHFSIWSWAFIDH